MNHSVKSIKRRIVYSGYHQINQVNLQYERFEGGWSPSIQHEVIIRKDAVAVLLFDPKRSNFVFIEQFRTGACVRAQDELQSKSPWLLEIVAGDVEAGESFEEVAIREVLEETGLTLRACLPIYEFWVSPANHSGKIMIFFRQDR
jgi:ADP-ribose pyrophosphatase